MSDRDSPVLEALAALRAGRPAVILGGRGPFGTVVLPGGLATPHWTSWMIRYTSGLLCAPMPAERADSLDLPPMVSRGRGRGAAFAVAVDARDGVSTGISATDRARTAVVLADPAAGPGDLVRPGHVLPVRVPPGISLEQQGQAGAAVALCQLAALPPVALTATLVCDEGPVASGATVTELAGNSGLAVVGTAEIVRHRHYHGDGVRPRLRRIGQGTLPSAHGELRAIGYHDELTGAEHLAVLSNTPPGSVPLVHVHTESPAGQLIQLPSAARLDGALARICASGGVVVYLRGGRTGDRLDAPAAAPCDHGAAAAILVDLGMTTIRLLSRTATGDGLRPGGITVVETRYPAASTFSA